MTVARTLKSLLIPNMNVPEILESEKLCASLQSEKELLEARLAVLQASDVSAKLKELSELKEKMKVLIEELSALQKGKLVAADEAFANVPSQTKGGSRGSDEKPRRPRISVEDAYKAIVDALASVPEQTMTRAVLAEKTGLALPKISEGIKFDASKFKVTLGPSATIKLLSTEA